MDNLVKYSFPNLVKAFAQHKQSKKEGFNETSTESRIMGISYGIFILLLVISAAMWITALVLLIKNINQMPTWAVIFAILFLLSFAGGPIITIILTSVKKHDEFY